MLAAFFWLALINLVFYCFSADDVIRFGLFSIFQIFQCFCTAFNLLTPIFMLPYIIMDLPIFVIAEGATLLVDIRCPQGGS